MKGSLVLALVLSCEVACACDAGKHSEDENACQKFGNIEVDESDATVAPNVALIVDEYMNPTESVKNISRDELLRLYRAVKPFAASSFSSSTSKFEVMIRYTLWKDKPGQLDVRTNAGQPEGEMLTEFRRQAATLTDFHPTNGKVWVLLDFQVSPSASARVTNDYSAYELEDFPRRN